MKVHPSVRFRQLVDNPLTHLTWYAEVCAELGLTGVSQVWNEDPAWYVWLGGRAYLLRHAGLKEDTGEMTAVLHAFPTAEELAAGGFDEEMSILLDEVHFDHRTLTPRFEAYPRFVRAFIVGELTLFPGEKDFGAVVFSGYEEDFATVWRFGEFFVAMLTFFSKTPPLAGPWRFTPQPGILSAGVALDQAGFERLQRDFVDTGLQPLENPDLWQRLAHGGARCSAQGACACKH